MNDSTALKRISLQFNLLYMQYIYYAEDEEAVGKGRKITDIGSENEERKK